MIIYNPFLPPNARRLRIKDYESSCGRIRWREERIKSLDGTEIALCVSEGSKSARKENHATVRSVYILYLQGTVLFPRVIRCITVDLLRRGLGN
jgi:uncharacterized protein